jgi:Domain of unknown function (DUF1707)
MDFGLLAPRRSYDSRVFASDGDRERAAVTLREHYVRGRLTLDELSRRTDRVLTARTQEEIHRALAGLPGSVLSGMALLPGVRDLVTQGQSVAKTVLRGAVLALFTGAYLLFSIALLLVLGLVLLVNGASDAALIAYLVVWLVPTYLLARVWYRRRDLVSRAYRRL